MWVARRLQSCRCVGTKPRRWGVPGPKLAHRGGQGTLGPGEGLVSVGSRRVVAEEGDREQDSSLGELRLPDQHRAARSSVTPNPQGLDTGGDGGIGQVYWDGTILTCSG